MTWTQPLSPRQQGQYSGSGLRDPNFSPTTLVVPEFSWVDWLHQPLPHTVSEHAFLSWLGVSCVWQSIMHALSHSWVANSLLTIHHFLYSFLPTKLCFTGFSWWVFVCLFCYEWCSGASDMFIFFCLAQSLTSYHNIYLHSSLSKSSSSLSPFLLPRKEKQKNHHGWRLYCPHISKEGPTGKLNGMK